VQRSMALYTSDHPDIPKMRGLHLFHFAISNCSQRVRMALEEKGLEWESHHLNLPGNEHLSVDYQRINPNGVVPTLVHDGQVVLESNDIITYLDETFPEPPLLPSDATSRNDAQQRIASASAAQGTIKVLSHELVFRPFRKISEEELVAYETQHNDPSLAVFLRDFMDNGEAWRQRLEAAQIDMKARLATLEAVLEGQSWLSGEAFGLADISWIVNVHRLSQAKCDLSAYPKLLAWYATMQERSAFDRAIARYQP
jgi:glutathione S-transferase